MTTTRTHPVLREDNDPVPPPALEADDLRSKSPEELTTLYRNGRAPSSLEAIEGDPRGVGVGLNVWAGGWLDRYLRKATLNERFLWNGKSFRKISETEGWGFNRVGRGGLLAIFPFKTSIGPSIIDGEPCVIIDYDVKRNPWWERLTYDELREVSPGVHLGFTTVRIFGRRPLVLWFAVDCTSSVKHFDQMMIEMLEGK